MHIFFFNLRYGVALLVISYTSSLTKDEWYQVPAAAELAESTLTRPNDLKHQTRVRARPTCRVRPARGALRDKSRKNPLSSQSSHALYAV